MRNVTATRHRFLKNWKSMRITSAALLWQNHCQLVVSKRTRCQLGENSVFCHFDNKKTTSINSAAIQKDLTVNLATSFMKEKMLMFNNTSFFLVLSMAWLMCFVSVRGTKQLRAFMKSIRFKNVFIYQNLTNTNSTSLFFVFICNLSSQLKRKDSRTIILKAWFVRWFLDSAWCLQPKT